MTRLAHPSSQNRISPLDKPSQTSKWQIVKNDAPSPPTPPKPMPDRRSVRGSPPVVSRIEKKKQFSSRDI